MGGLGGVEVILLDTHVLVWMVTDPKRLSRAADREIRKAQHDRSCAIASITLWELALLFRGNRLRGTGIHRKLHSQHTGRYWSEGVGDHGGDRGFEYVVSRNLPERPRGPIDRRHCPCLWADSYHAGRKDAQQPSHPFDVVARFGTPTLLSVSDTHQTPPGTVQCLSSAGSTASTAAACADLRRGCGSSASSTASSRDRRVGPEERSH